MQIDFYVLETTSSQKARFFACQLIEKLYVEQQKNIYVNMTTQDEAEQFDALLWTWRDDSFIPHQVYDINKPPVSVQIGSGVTPNVKDVLLNFHSDIPAFYPQFDYLVEIVFINPQIQQAARDRFKQYREQGHTVNTIKKLKAELTP